MFAVFFQELLADHPFYVADAELLARDAAAHFNLLTVISERKERAGVAGRDDAVAKAIEHRLRQFQEAHQIGDRAAVDFQATGQIFLGTAMLIEVALERKSLFNRVEILPLQVFHDGEFRHQAIIRVPQAGGNRLPAR